MFVHLVLIKLKPGITRTDPRVPAWEAKFKGLKDKCAGIVRFEFGYNFTDRPVAYDIGINMAFDTRENLVAYGPQPGAPGGRGRAARDRRVGHLRLRGRA